MSFFAGRPDGFAPLLPGFKVVAFDNLDEALAAVDENTAGFLLEPVQGEGGIRPASKEFLAGLPQAVATATRVIEELDVVLSKLHADCD